MALKKVGVDPKGFDRSQIKYYIILAPFVAFMLLPIIFIFNHAFKPMDELFAYPPRFLVRKPSLVNFRTLFRESQISSIPISRYIFNSLVVTITVLVLSIFISTMAGYVLSKKQFKSKKLLLEINNIALMFVATAVTIPRYLVIEFLGIQDTMLAHILPLLVMPVGLFLVKQFIDQVPDQLIEAAVIDGATDFQIYRKVILPLIKPAIATLTILSFQLVWNNLETSQLFVTRDSLRTLAFYMSTLASQSNVVAGQGVAAAASLIMFVPNLVLFIIFQSNVMSMMSHSGIK
ncbi:MAG: carbohydrate ABC transporter permease [Bacteroidales bacterium]|nr:carbohydrate ABC transporter permease [Bacteroidales bacterium]